MPTEYTTLRNEATVEFTEKRSRFIGHAKPVDNEQAAIELIEQARSKYWDATHNVYAYAIREGQLCRYSDDGEPSGTAGMPTLSVLTKGGITNAVIIVTRYFGGVLLGTGGLVRAYSHTAGLAVEAAGLMVMRSYAVCAVRCDYTDYGRVAAVIPDSGGIIDDSRFSDAVELEIRALPESIEQLRKRLADASCGRAQIDLLGEVIAPS